MNPDFIKTYFKEAMVKSLRTGGSTMISELAETLDASQLKALIALLQVTLKKKETIIDVKVVK